jgi:hypothetical protein
MIRRYWNDLDNWAFEFYYRHFIGSSWLWPIFWFQGLLLLLFRVQERTWGTCPWCNFSNFEMYEKPWIEYTAGGSSYVPGEPTIHWFEGIQTCPRCRYKWYVQDSD